MFLDSAALDSLYSKYGFQIVPTSFANVRAYALRTGYFLNADIVPLDDDALPLGAKEELDAAGYACSVRVFQSLQDAEHQLFEGFFAAESSRERLMQEYERFAGKVTRALGAQYEYVSGPYVPDMGKPAADLDIISYLLTLLRSDGPTLVILEAAAGFGKTCTAYEVLRRLLFSSTEQVPLITELSLNRQAKIFRYVLLDEIDRNFPALRSQLVREQIQRGRMPLIVDGFDELLYRGGSVSEQFEDAEPMLETISVLLQDQAKVLLTTRRTAIFSESEFQQWVEARPEEFAVHRVRLDRPTIEDWLGVERSKLLGGKGIPVKELSNPVLLAFLKNVDDSRFVHLCDHPEEIVRAYFSAMLEREVDRQDLLMSVPDQISVFRSLATDMAKEAFTAEQREYIQIRILDRNLDLLERTRLDYRRDQRPTAEELATKLASHALLDRRGTDEQQVGFVNDFVFGTLIGDSIVQSELPVERISDYELFVDLATTAYLSQHLTTRWALWNQLSEVLDLFDVTRQFVTDLALTGTLRRNLENVAIVGVASEDCELGREHSITSSVFIDCIFRRARLVGRGFSNVTFLNCTFYECAVEQGVTVDNPIRLISPSGDMGSLAELQELSERAREVEVDFSEAESFERTVLENFWPRGRAHFSRSRQLRTLYRGNSNEDYDHIGDAIERLRKRGLIEIIGDHADLNLQRLDEIREILGRNV
jgi:hypothetical protein